MAQEEGRARFVEIARIRAGREVGGFRRWKLAGGAEHAGRGVDLHCCLQQLVLDDRMKVSAHHQAGLGADLYLLSFIVCFEKER